MERPSPCRVEATGEDSAPSVPTEVLLLDYDRELAYLEREGRLRGGGMRPTGFKQ